MNNNDIKKLLRLFEKSSKTSHLLLTILIQNMNYREANNILKNGTLNILFQFKSHLEFDLKTKQKDLVIPLKSFQFYNNLGNNF